MSRKQLARNISSMSVAVLISRALGLARDIFMTNFFGTTYVADAFQVAFQIPNLLRKLFGEGALSAAFVPTYNEIGVKKGPDHQIRFALNVLSLLCLALVLLCLLGIILAPVILKLIAPGFEGRTYFLALKLTRILFPYLFLIGMSSTFISILNSHDYYFIPGLSSAFLNLAMIGTLGIFILMSDSSTIEDKISVWTLGVILGGILQTIINLPLLKKLNYRIKLIIHFKGEALASVWRRFIPGVIGIAVRQINLWVDMILASLLVTGSIAALSYGNRLMQLPLGIFGVSAGVAVLPMFSKYVAEGKWPELKDSLKFSIMTVALIMFPVTALMAGLGRDIIRVIFLRGAFDQVSLEMTYRALLFYSLGLFFFSINRLLIPIFYARKNTRTPVVIAGFISVLNIILNIILMQFLQHAGLALATTISAIFHFFVLRKVLDKKIPELVFPGILRDIVKIIAASLILYLIISLLNPYFVITDTFHGIMKLLVFGIFGLVFYLLLTRLFKIEYTGRILKVLWKRLLRK